MPLPALALSVLGSRAGQVAIAAVVAGAVGFGSGYRMADDAAEVEKLTADIKAMKDAAALSAQAREVAAAREKFLQAQLVETRDRLRAIEEWTDEMDGPVGDGLRDVLRGLREP